MLELSHSVMSNYLPSHGLWPTRLLCPWNFPGKNTGARCHFLLQGIFPTQGFNPHLFPSPALVGGFFTTVLPGNGTWKSVFFQKLPAALLGIQIWEISTLASLALIKEEMSMWGNVQHIELRGVVGRVLRQNTGCLVKLTLR